MKKLLLLITLAPLLSFSQINIELESHAFVRNGISRSGCYYGNAAFEDGTLTLVLNLKHIVKVEVRNGTQKDVYTISKDGIYDVNVPMSTDNFIIIFTDWQGVKLWWYRN